MSVEALEGIFLSDDDLRRLKEAYPGFDRACPTCGDTGRYFPPEGGGDFVLDCDCDEQRRLYKHYLNAGIGELYQRIGWEDFDGDQEALAKAKAWMYSRAKYFTAGIGMWFHGPYGTGKTTLAMLVAKDCVRDGRSVYAVTFPEMIERFTMGWRDATDKRWFERRVVGSDLLVLDDLGKEYLRKGGNNLAESTFDFVLRQRVVALRPTILTTNMDEAEVRRGYGGAVLSLLSESAVKVMVPGSDRRPEVADRRIAEAKAGVVRRIQ